MAESIVSSAAQKLGTLLTEKAKFLHGVRGQVEQMQIELTRMQSFLKDADNRQDEDVIVRNWVSEIRELAYDAEDVIDTIVLNSQSRTGIKNVLKRGACFFKEWQQLDEVGSEIEAIKSKISSLTSAMQTYGIRQQSQGEGSSSTYRSQRQYSHVEDDIVVGFEEDIKKLVAELVGEKKPHRVVSICGMGGLGKTTLAKKVYHHNDVRQHFDAFAWASISQQFQTRDVWEEILFKLISPSLEERKEILKLKDNELAEKLYKVQQDKKCLVILDDIWRTEAWDRLSPAFPLRRADSKILLTSRNKEVALHVDPTGFLHDLRCLGEQESWELFKKKAFPKDEDLDEQESWELFQKKAFPREDDPGFVEVGRKIVKRCGGVPLAIVALGGLLAKKDLTEWKRVFENVDSYLTDKGQAFVVQKVLALSYHDLPYQLKPCFLYLSHFPEDFNIPAKKLTQMWVAEGFVSTTQDEVQGEEIAERYLHELIDRSMVQVGKISYTGRIKTCRLHDLMRDLSRSIAKQENFFKFIEDRDGNERTESSTSVVSISRVHRISIFGDHQDTIRSILPSKSERNFHLRSLLLPEGKEITVKERQLKSMFNKFRLLRVISFGVNSQRTTLDTFFLLCLSLPFPALFDPLLLRELRQLRNARILKLPSSIGNLGCLQFLNLQLRNFLFDDRLLVIPNVIWKMERLRHVYFPHPYSWTSTGKLQMGNLRNLQTLVNFLADKCDIKDLFKLTNLRKLSLHFEDPTSLKKFVEMFEPPCVTLNKLWSLSLIKESPRGYEKIDVGRIVSGCPHLYKLYVKGVVLEKLPSYEQFPSNITKLVLYSSELEEDPMPTLEKLPNLKILRLGWAFNGPKMVCSKEGFRQLKSLLFDRLFNLKEWWVEEGAMPSLHRLEILGCWRLKNVPDGLRFITTLRELEFSGMTWEFDERLKGGEDFDKIKHVPSVSIYF